MPVRLRTGIPPRSGPKEAAGSPGADLWRNIRSQALPRLAPSGLTRMVHSPLRRVTPQRPNGAARRRRHLCRFRPARKSFAAQPAAPAAAWVASPCRPVSHCLRCFWAGTLAQSGFTSFDGKGRPAQPKTCACGREAWRGTGRRCSRLLTPSRPVRAEEERTWEPPTAATKNVPPRVIARRHCASDARTPNTQESWFTAWTISSGLGCTYTCTVSSRLWPSTDCTTRKFPVTRARSLANL